MTFQSPLASQGGMDVYEQPQKDRTYCIVADTAQGKAQDYSALSVFDITEIPYRQVAKYRSNKITPMLYPNVVYNIGMRYNTAWTLIEVNDVGQQVAESLHFVPIANRPSWKIKAKRKDLRLPVSDLNLPRALAQCCEKFNMKETIVYIICPKLLLQKPESGNFRPSLVIVLVRQKFTC